MSRKHTLIVNHSDSRCGNCGRGAKPSEATHQTVLGYFAAGHEPETGCGVRWVFIDSDYRPFTTPFSESFRPDLVRATEGN